MSAALLFVHWEKRARKVTVLFTKNARGQAGNRNKQPSEKRRALAGMSRRDLSWARHTRPRANTSLSFVSVIPQQAVAPDPTSERMQTSSGVSCCTESQNTLPASNKTLSSHPGQNQLAPRER